MPDSSFFGDLSQPKPSTSTGGGSFFGDLATKPTEKITQTAASEDKAARSIAPKAADFVPDSDTLWNLAKGAAGGTAGLASGTINTIFHPIEAAKGAYQTGKQAVNLARQGQIIPSIATAAGLAGFNEPELAQKWAQGKGSEAIGEALPSAIVAAEGAEKAAGRGSLEIPAVGRAREAIGAKIHVPETGALTPGGKMLGQAGGFVGGALAAKAAHIPVLGDYIAGHIAEHYGPGMVERMFPEPEQAKIGRINAGNEQELARGAQAIADKINARPKPQPVPDLPTISREPFSLIQEQGPEPEQQNLKFPTLRPEPEPVSAAPQSGRIPTMADLGRLIEQEGAGARPLERNVPIGKQVPAKFPEVGQVPLGNRVAMDVREMSGERRVNAPEKIPTIPQEEAGRQMGAPPRIPNVPLREQLKPTPEAMAYKSEQARLEEKYPDKAIRQFAHSLGDEMVDTIGDNPELLRQAHDLRNPDVRQAAINGGMNMVREDGSPIMVNNRKASGDMTRQIVFRELLKRGYSPEDIVRMGQEQAEPVGAAAGKPGPTRAEGKSSERKAG